MTNAEQEILRQKLQKFKDDNNINDYDLGLEIGLSSDTILNFRKGRDILPRSLDKIAEFFKTYVTPEQKISNLQRENAELKAENERLKEEVKEVKKYQYEQEFLEKEIEEQREKNKRLTCKILEVKALNETLNVQCTSQDCTQLRKLHQTLQEIKTIAEKLKSPHCTDCTQVLNKKGKCTGECMYDYKKIILDLITKAEEE